MGDSSNPSNLTDPSNSSNSSSSSSSSNSANGSSTGTTTSSNANDISTTTTSNAANGSTSTTTTTSNDGSNPSNLKHPSSSSSNAANGTTTTTSSNANVPSSTNNSNATNGSSSSNSSNIPTTTSSTTNDAVSLCSQNSYPGDDELEVLEKEIMEKWRLDQAPDIVAVGASPDQAESRKNVDLAKMSLAQGKQPDALVYFDQALEADYENPGLWLQRATTVIALGDLREAFRSCGALPPAMRTAGLWKVGGSILDKLGLPVMAEQWLRHATRLANADDSTAAILFQKVRAKRLYAPLTQDMPVEVTFTAQGRALRATKAVKKGQTILADRPMLLAQTLPSLRFPCCANCVKSLIRPEDVFNAEEMSKSALKKALKAHWPARERHPCACGHEVYCSRRCQTEAWDNYHRLICSKVNPASERLHQVCESFKDLTATNCSAFDGWWSACFSPVLLARLWAQIVCAAVQLAKGKGRHSPSPQDWALARAPYRRFIAYGSGIKADTFPKMHELMREIFRDLGDGLSYNISKEEFSGRYLQLACNSQSFSDADNPMGYLCRGVHRDPMLSPLLSYFRQKEHEGDFAGLFPVHACLNHSCANNAVVADGKTPEGRPGCHVRAKRDIAVGEEVCNQYIDINQTRKQRRFQLYRSYNFWCECSRCQFEGDGPEACTECGVKSPPGTDLPKCSRCKQAWYCSTQCQKKAWKRGHKKICNLGE